MIQGSPERERKAITLNKEAEQKDVRKEGVWLGTD